jgi:hypothetical protein
MTLDKGAARNQETDNYIVGFNSKKLFSYATISSRLWNSCLRECSQSTSRTKFLYFLVELMNFNYVACRDSSLYCIDSHHHQGLSIFQNKTVPIPCRPNVLVTWAVSQA